MKIEVKLHRCSAQGLRFHVSSSISWFQAPQHENVAMRSAKGAALSTLRSIHCAAARETTQLIRQLVVNGWLLT